MSEKRLKLGETTFWVSELMKLVQPENINMDFSGEFWTNMKLILKTFETKSE